MSGQCITLAIEHLRLDVRITDYDHELKREDKPASGLGLRRW